MAVDSANGFQPYLLPASDTAASAAAHYSGSSETDKRMSVRRSEGLLRSGAGRAEIRAPERTPLLRGQYRVHPLESALAHRGCGSVSDPLPSSRCAVRRCVPVPNKAACAMRKVDTRDRLVSAAAAELAPVIDVLVPAQASPAHLQQSLNQAHRMPVLSCPPMLFDAPRSLVQARQ